MLKIKVLYAVFVSFFQQIGIRPIVSNIKMLFTNLCLIFSKQPEPLYKKKHELNLQFLKRFITSLPKDDIESSPVKNYRIWTLWWQGEAQMPPIVKATIESIKKSTNKEVVIITKDNYLEWIELPDCIKEKIRTNGIGLAHLSDYIRISLLCKYGGLWIDSTVYCANRIPEWIYNQTFFTIKASSHSHKYIPMGKWNMQILGSNQTNCRIFVYMKYFLEEYWSKYDKPIDYCFFDYGMEIQYNNDKNSKQLIDNVPMTNENMHSLLPILNSTYDEHVFSGLISNTTFFKLTYKLNFLNQINPDSYYKKIIEP